MRKYLQNVTCKVQILLFVVVISAWLNNSYAKEPFLAKLVTIENSSYLKFTHNNQLFTCKTYGIYTLDEIYKRSDNSTCKKMIEKFYILNPLEKHYVYTILKKGQYYPIRFIKGECDISVASHKSYSELLLEQGLAINKKKIDDKLRGYYFKKAQQRAKENKSGIYSAEYFNICIDTFNHLYE